jgi:hypothetical protein
MSQAFVDHVALVQDVQQVPGLDRDLSAEVLW